MTPTPPPAPVDLDAIDSVLAKVRYERRRQHAIWGTQRHSWPEWISILTEEVGEAARDANQIHWGTTQNLPTLSHLREELIHAAAVAVQIIEHIDELQEGIAQ